MNETQTPVLNSSKGAKHWLPNSVRTLLHNRATIGYLPASKVNVKMTEIAGYFPPVITNDLFYAVNDISVPAIRSKDKKDKPQYPETVHLFKKLVKCRYCGENVFPNGAKSGYWGRLRCMGHHTKTCEAPPISRYDFEHTLVTRMFPLLKFMEVTSEENPVAVLQAKIDHLESSINNLMDQMEDTTSSAVRKRLSQRLDKLADEQEGFQRQIITTRRRLDVRTENTLSNLSFDSYTERLKMQLIISRNIERIVLDTLFDKVHVKLVNGNALMNFPLFGDVDASHILIAAKDKLSIPDEVEELLGVVGMLPTIFNLAKSNSADERVFPEIEPDIANTDENGFPVDPDAV